MLKTWRDFELEGPLVDKVVKVTWEDSNEKRCSSKYMLKHAPTAIITTFGLVVRDNSKELELVTSKCSEWTFEDYKTIARREIREIIILSEAGIVS